MNVGVIVARFQTPYLHNGHKSFINQVLEKHKKVIFILGVSPALPNNRDPLSFEVRKILINRYIESLRKVVSKNIQIYPLKDIPDDNLWSKKLDDLIKEKVDKAEEVILYGSRDSFIKNYTGVFKTQYIQQDYFVSSSEIRQELKTRIPLYLEFREGIIHSIMNRPPISYPTVDIACFNRKDNTVLLGRKPDESLWRFPGGFFDSTVDNSFINAAKREFREEVGLIETSGWAYYGSAKMDDWRYKKTNDCIITSLFICDYNFGKPKASDDLAELAWMKWQTDIHKIIVPVHHKLLKMLGLEF